MGDSIDQAWRSAAGGFLGALGNAVSPKTQVQPADVKVAEAQSRWDWRMVGIIGAVVVGLVLLMRMRK